MEVLLESLLEKSRTDSENCYIYIYILGMEGDGQGRFMSRLQDLIPKPYAYAYLVNWEVEAESEFDFRRPRGSFRNMPTSE